MSNQNGTIHAITTLSPILQDSGDVSNYSHDLQLRRHLATIPLDETSPFAATGVTHFARLVVMDDVIFAGAPAQQEHLQSKYLLHEANSDQDFETYFANLATKAPEALDAIWSHCAGYPGCVDIAGLIRYMKKCQLNSELFFVAVNDRSVAQTLLALRTQRLVSDFIARHQGSTPQKVQQDFLELVHGIKRAPALLPATPDNYLSEMKG